MTDTGRADKEIKCMCRYDDFFVCEDTAHTYIAGNTHVSAGETFASCWENISRCCRGGFRTLSPDMYVRLVMRCVSAIR